MIYVITLFILYIVISIILILILSKQIVDYKSSEIFTDSYQNEIVTNVLQIIAYDYHVRLIRCGYGEIMDHCAKGYMRFEDSIQWKCFELGSSPKDAQYSINFYREKTFDYLVYTIHFRLFGIHYIAYGKNPLIAWAVVIRTARAENRKIFSKYPDKHKIK